MLLGGNSKIEIILFSVMKKAINIFLAIILLAMEGPSLAQEISSSSGEVISQIQPKAKCINKIPKCLDNGDISCKNPEAEPVCVGDSIACCKNNNGKLSCKSFKDSDLVYGNEVVCGDEITDFGKISNTLLGDFNNDKKTDIAFRIKETGDWFVSTVSQSGKFSTVSYGKWSNNVGWIDVVVGDFDQDGFVDDVAGRAEKTGDWWVSFSDGQKFENIKFGKWSKGFKWNYVNVLDFDGDKFVDDIVGVESETGELLVSLSDGKKFINQAGGSWSNEKKWTNIYVTDFDGDEKTDDILAKNNSTDEWELLSSNGKKFTVKKLGKWSKNYSFTNIHLGDFNGDGLKNDIIAYAKENGEWWLLRFNGEVFESVLLGTWDNKYKWKDILFGKFNDDKYEDILGTLSLKSFGWLIVSEINDKKFKNKYYSGPTIDLSENPILDDYGNWPPHVELINLIVADFNGDNIDDVAGRVPSTNDWVFLRVENRDKTIAELDFYR